MQRRKLGVQELESRETPAAFGTPWPDGEHLTLSLAPANTSIANELSNLDPANRMAILTAFQTWAVQAKLNIGLVGDDGSWFGTPGPVQGDDRFGDIRVGGVPLP